jgi:hypothetical protein
MKFAPAILTGCISTLIALLVFGISKLSDYRKEKRRIRNVRKYFFVCLTNFATGVLGQATELLGKAELLKKDLESDPKKPALLQLEIYVHSSPMPILEIKKEDTFKFFVLDNNNSTSSILEYTNLYSQLETIKEYKNEIYKHWESELKEHKELSDKLDCLKGELMKKLSFRLTANQNPKTGKYTNLLYKDLDEFHDALVKEYNSSIEVLISKVITPIAETCFKHDTQIETRNEANEFTSDCKDIKTVYDKLINLKRSSLKIYEGWHKDYLTVFKSVTALLNTRFKDLSSMKFDR